jgi:RES domain-containing protein
MTICAYAIDCEGILDLTDAEVLAGSAATPADLACAWEDIADRGGRPPSWLLAERLIAAGHAGIVVPSYAAGAGPGDRNLVLWRWADTPPHRVRVVDDYARLPKDDRSWH